MADPIAPQTEGASEDLEGFEWHPTLEEPSPYPLDDVMVRSETRTVAEVVKRIKTNRYIMDPDFQRDFVWSNAKQSKLIESCVMRIPLPVFYVAESHDGRVAVVDGLQRLSSFKRFLDNELALSGLGEEHPLLGKTFDDLPIPDPRGRAGKATYFWHGKIKTPQYRIHFEWPIPAPFTSLAIGYIGPKIAKH